MLVYFGAYMAKGNIFDVGLAFLAGVFGYTMRRSGFPLITVVMGFILGPLVERAFLQTLQMSDGNYSVFFTRPVSAVLVMFCVFVLLFSFFKSRRERQKRMST